MASGTRRRRRGPLAVATAAPRGGDDTRGTGRRPQPVPLWLGVHFPHLPIEVFTRATEAAGACIVVGGKGRDQRVIGASDAARTLGVAVGMQASAAHALGTVRAFVRDTRAETDALGHLAAFAGQFTPEVVPVAPATLLLELRGSLGLFGGFAPLLAQLRAGFTAIGHHYRLASAPTPLAATWFARAGTRVHVAEPARLAGALAALPVEAIDCDPRVHEACRGFGVHTLGALARLPRGGLARRFGRELVVMLDRAYGRCPDPRRAYVPPASFVQRIELPDAVTHAGPLAFVGRRQLLALAGFLRGRGAGVARLHWRLEHPDKAATVLTIGLLAPDRDADRLLGLLRERLEGTRLAAPVVALVLEAAGIVPLADLSGDLFADTPAAVERERTSLVERLRARLGEEAITGLCLVAEHRPEYAWRTCEPGSTGALPVSRPRPLWLLAAPRPLEIVAAQPWLGGRLVFGAERERIESGWWDGSDVARDYFVAENPAGSRFWVYRDLRDRRWYVHGIFE